MVGGKHASSSLPGDSGDSLLGKVVYIGGPVDSDCHRYCMSPIHVSMLGRASLAVC